MKKIVDIVEEFFLKIFEKIGLGVFVKWYREHQEGMRYLVFGALSTIVNIAVYYSCYYLVHIPNAISNGIAWVLSVIFAYFTNKLCVFDSKVETIKDLIFEVTSFFGCRLFTLAIDEAIMIVTVDNFGWNGLLMKIIANIVVIILNFIFSKLIIFKKGTKKEESK